MKSISYKGTIDSEYSRYKRNILLSLSFFMIGYFALFSYLEVKADPLILSLKESLESALVPADREPPQLITETTQGVLGTEDANSNPTIAIGANNSIPGEAPIDLFIYDYVGTVDIELKLSIPSDLDTLGVLCPKDIKCTMSQEDSVVTIVVPGLSVNSKVGKYTLGYIFYDRSTAGRVTIDNRKKATSYITPVATGVNLIDGSYFEMPIGRL